MFDYLKDEVQAAAQAITQNGYGREEEVRFAINATIYPEKNAKKLSKIANHLFKDSHFLRVETNYVRAKEANLAYKAFLDTKYEFANAIARDEVCQLAYSLSGIIGLEHMIWDAHAPRGHRNRPKVVEVTPEEFQHNKDLDYEIASSSLCYINSMMKAAKRGVGDMKIENHDLFAFCEAISHSAVVHDDKTTMLKPVKKQSRCH